jgi:2-C-methyl-D-erythritol 2,4-cyclodiphosphate synthase
VRVGFGLDAHRLAPGRPLVLGGVTVPHDRGLVGHSDADVLTHAMIDALLGAAALGDVGGMFPDDDPAWAGASSLDLARRAVARVRAAGFEVENVDGTIVAQAPRIAPHAAAMRARVAEALGVAVDRVSIKATTTEGMGPEGRGEGIAAHAVATLRRRDEIA